MQLVIIKDHKVMFIHPFDNIVCENTYIDRHFDTQSRPFEKESVVSEKKRWLKAYRIIWIWCEIYDIFFTISCVFENNKIIQYICTLFAHRTFLYFIENK